MTKGKLTDMETLSLTTPSPIIVRGERAARHFVVEAFRGNMSSLKHAILKEFRNV